MNLFIPVFGLVTIIFVILAILFYRWSHRLEDIRTLRLGRLTILFWLFVLGAFNSLVGLLIILSGNNLSLGLILLIAEVLIISVVTSLLGFILPISILILTVKMWRRESRSIANLLLPIVMLLFLLFDAVYRMVEHLSDGYLWLRILAFVYPVLSLYLTWQFLVFLVSSLVYGRRMKKNERLEKYFVVHGAGLIAGNKVGKLLANRIKAAIESSDEETIFIMSGGKGDDEHLSEAQAMKNYAIEELGLDPKRILLEDQSKTTYENLMNSKALLEGKNFSFFTSDYHVFRTALFAASIGLSANGGQGGKTAFYFRAPAFIREFIAILNSERKKHIILISLIISFFILAAALVAFLQFMPR